MRPPLRSKKISAARRRKKCQDHDRRQRAAESLHDSRLSVLWSVPDPLPPTGPLVLVYIARGPLGNVFPCCIEIPKLRMTIVGSPCQTNKGPRRVGPLALQFNWMKTEWNYHPAKLTDDSSLHLGAGWDGIQGTRKGPIFPKFANFRKFWSAHLTGRGPA